MKKITALALGVSLALGLTGCNPNSNTVTADPESVAEVAAEVLKSGIDLTAVDQQTRAQDDFFRYVNGAWLARTEIPGDKSRYGMFNVLYDKTQENLKAIIQEAAASVDHANPNAQKLGDMYNSYMNTEKADELGLTPLSAELESINNVDGLDGVAAEMGKLFNMGVEIPFGFFVYPDAKDPTTYGMWMYQSGLTLPDKDYYFKEEEKFVNFRNATQTFIADLLAAAGREDAQTAAKAVMELEKRIAEKHLSRVDSRDAEKNYNKRSAAEVAELLKGFGFEAYTKASGVDHVTDIIVRQLPYFEAFGELFASTDVQTWKDYMTFKLLDEYAPRLNKELVDTHFAFHSTTLNGIPEQRPRWKRAVAATSTIMGELLGQQYVERHFTPEAKAKMDSLVQNLIKAYGESIKELEWMTEETKVAALDKLSKFTHKNWLSRQMARLLVTGR